MKSILSFNVSAAIISLFFHTVNANAHFGQFDIECKVPETNNVCKVQFCSGDWEQTSGMADVLAPRVPEIFIHAVAKWCNLMAFPYLLDQKEWPCFSPMHGKLNSKAHAYQVFLSPFCFLLVGYETDGVDVVELRYK